MREKISPTVVNEQVFKLMKESVPEELWDNFLNFMASQLQDIEHTCVDGVMNLFTLWKEGVARDELVSKLMKENVPETLWNKFLSFMKSRLASIKNASVNDVMDSYDIWKESVAREKRDRAILGHDY